MIDTVCLLIPKEKLTIVDHDRWQETRTGKVVRNLTVQDKKYGWYLPRATVYGRSYGREPNVRIEFSVPKLVYENNLDELENSDFLSVVKTLKERLEIIGITASEEILANASVSSVHYSRNILLENGYTVNHLISEMNKVNLRKTYDFARSRYMNEGQSLYVHTSSCELIVYDKVADLAKGAKRSMDRDQTLYQRTFLGSLRGSEIIRFEVRFTQKKKLNEYFTKFGYTKNPTFSDVFNSRISVEVVWEHWQRLIKKKSLGTFTMKLSPSKTLELLQKRRPELKPKQAVYLLGLLELSRSEEGLRQLRGVISRAGNERTWYRIAKDLSEISSLNPVNFVTSWATQIERDLSVYKPYKMAQNIEKIIEAKNVVNDD